MPDVHKRRRTLAIKPQAFENILNAICGGFKSETGEFLGNFFMNLVFCKAELHSKKRSILVCLSLKKNLNASVYSFKE